MWLNTASNLNIYKSRYLNILTRHIPDEDQQVLAEMQALKYALNHQHCEEFLISRAAAIEVLKIQGDVPENPMNAEHLELKVKSFKHLKKLMLQQMALTDEDLQVIGQNCPQLKCLHIIKCFCKHFQVLIPGVNINIAEICNFKQLEELAMQPEKAPGVERLMKMEYIQTMLDRLPNLEHLNLKGFTIVCKDEEKTNATELASSQWPIQVLHMGFITFDFWCTFTGFLKCCPQLRDLCIQAPKASEIVINFKIIDILCIYCQNLKILQLENCELDVKNFSDLTALQEITLSFCRGLTFNNLQQILGGLNLKVFKLIHTRVFDATNFIYISPTLESITVDSIHFMEISEMFQRSLNNFSNLKTLQWLNGDIDHNWIAEKCPQLQQLLIVNSYHLWRLVLNMKSLNELTITSLNGISWSLLHSLIFKLALKHLNIYCDCVISDVNSNSLAPSLMMPTTLEFLVLPLKIFMVALKYWLELLDVNKHLKFLTFGSAEDILNVRFICLLLATDCVRQRRKRIKICGFKLGEIYQHWNYLQRFVLVYVNNLPIFE